MSAQGSVHSQQNTPELVRKLCGRIKGIVCPPRERPSPAMSSSAAATRKSTMRQPTKAPRGRGRQDRSMYSFSMSHVSSGARQLIVGALREMAGGAPAASKPASRSCYSLAAAEEKTVCRAWLRRFYGILGERNIFPSIFLPLILSWLGFLGANSGAGACSWRRPLSLLLQRNPSRWSCNRRSHRRAASLCCGRHHHPTTTLYPPPTLYPPGLLLQARAGRNPSTASRPPAGAAAACRGSACGSPCRSRHTAASTPRLAGCRTPGKPHRRRRWVPADGERGQQGGGERAPAREPPMEHTSASGCAPCPCSGPHM